jgi:OFA family oxalate/formate antiporter-like MFS transporter
MYVSNTLGSRTSIFIGGLIICASITATAYTNLPIIFFIFYAIGFGIGKGFIYPAPLRATWSHLPGRKGLVSGVITAGLGFGAFLYGLIVNYIVNPNNIKPIKT